MTSQFPMTYRPRFLTQLDFEYGDLLLRKAILEDMRREDRTGPIRTALEHESFFIELAEALVPILWDDSSDPQSNMYAIQNAIYYLREALTAHAALPDSDTYFYLLSRGDQARILEHVKGLTVEEIEDWGYEDTDSYAALHASLSETVSIDVLHASLLATIRQGGALNMPETPMQYSKETSPLLVTRNTIKDFKLKIPRHPFYTDDNTPVLSIQYPKPADGIRIVVTSTRDDVPDLNNPGQNKSEQHTVSLQKGENIMALTLTGHDMKYHEWTFTVEKVAAAEGEEAEA